MGRQANGTCAAASKKSHPASWPQGYVGQDSRDETTETDALRKPNPH